MERLSENENSEVQENEVVIFISEIEIEETKGMELKRWVVVHFPV
jgi:hypothetical protein